MGEFEELFWEEMKAQCSKFYATLVQKVEFEGEDRHLYASGVVVDLGDRWIWLTAAHVCEDWQRQLSQCRAMGPLALLLPNALLDQCVILDKTLEELFASAEKMKAIASSGQNAKELIDCLDYAWVSLLDLNKNELIAEGYEPLNVDQLGLLHIPDVHTFVVGCPADRVYHRDGSTVFSPTIIRLENYEVDRSKLISRHQWRLGHGWREASGSPELTTVKGMSGGPIFQVHYRSQEEIMAISVVALQSSWRPEKEQVLGVDLHGFLTYAIENSLLA